MEETSGSYEVKSMGRVWPEACWMIWDPVTEPCESHSPALGSRDGDKGLGTFPLGSVK